MNKKLYSLCLLALLCAQPAFGVFGPKKFFSKSFAKNLINTFRTPPYPKGNTAGALTSEQMLWKLKYGSLSDQEFETFAMSRIQKRIDYYKKLYDEAQKINIYHIRKAAIAKIPFFTKYYPNLKANEVVTACLLHTNPSIDKKIKKYFLETTLSGLCQSILYVRDNTIVAPLSTTMIMRLPSKTSASTCFLDTLEHETTHALEQKFNVYALFKNLTPSTKKLPDRLIEMAFKYTTTKKIKTIASYIHNNKNLNDVEPESLRNCEHEAVFTALRHIDYPLAYALLLKKCGSLEKYQDYPSNQSICQKILKENTFSEKQKKEELKIHKKYNPNRFRLLVASIKEDMAKYWKSLTSIWKSFFKNMEVIMNKKFYSLCLLVLLCTQPAFGVFGINDLSSIASFYYRKICSCYRSIKNRKTPLLTSENIVKKITDGTLHQNEFEKFAISRLQGRIDYYKKLYDEAKKIKDPNEREAALAEIPLFIKYYRNLKPNDVVDRFFLNSSPGAKECFFKGRGATEKHWERYLGSVEFSS